MCKKTGWLIALLSLTACAGMPQAISEVSDTIADLDAPLHEAYLMSQEVCLAIPEPKQTECIDKVRATWRPLIEGLTKIREIQCRLNPNAEGCK